MVLLYMATFTINIPQMLAYIPYMDPMGYSFVCLSIESTDFGIPEFWVDGIT